MPVRGSAVCPTRGRHDARRADWMLEPEQPEARYERVTGRWWERDVLAEVDQAVGMVAEQLAVPDAHAGLALRAYSAAHTQHPVDTALQVLHRELTFAS